MIPVISVVAFSGTGKTTFLEKLIPEIKKYGLRLAVVKHDAHDFQIDREGKDSWRMTAAGADVTGLISSTKAVLMENRPIEPETLIEKIEDVDLIITEGFKYRGWPKIMLHRVATGKPLPLRPEDCLAVVSDVPVEGCRSFFTLDDAEGVAALIVNYINGSDR